MSKHLGGIIGFKNKTKTHLEPIDHILTILPVVTKNLPISPRFTPYDFLSRCKFSTLTTRQPMVEFYLLTFPRFPLLKKEHKCEVGATARGCSGNIGSDDTRGYGVGSGDVGKELPRGMIP